MKQHLDIEGKSAKNTNERSQVKANKIGLNESINAFIDENDDGVRDED